MNSDQLSEVPVTKPRVRHVWVFWSAVLVVMIGGLTVFGRRTPVLRALMLPHDGAPRLVVDKNVVDLGAVPYRKMIAATFELSNGGKEVLEFTEAPYIEVVKGCCPPSPLLGKKALRPGEKTTLSVSFMMYQGMGGPHDFRVHLPTNDPYMPDRTVRVLSDWK